MRRLSLAIAIAGAAVVVLRFPRIMELFSSGAAGSIVAAVCAVLVPPAAGLAWHWNRRPGARPSESRTARLLDNRQFVLGTGVVALLTYAAVIAPVLSSFDPNTQTDLLGAATLAPSLQHPFGTDFYSRDLFSRMLYGARWSLGIALVAVTLVVVVGTSVGVIAGVTGGIVDSVLMRMVDGGLAIPRVLLLLVVAALWGNLGFFPLAVLLGLTGWFGVSRIIRAEVLSLKERTFLAAARALGISQLRLVVRHILPNLVAPVTVTAALGVGNIVLIEASLSYLGIGARPPDPGWGNIIREGHELIFTAPWISIFPGAAIFLTVIGFSLVGDGLRTALNPRAS